MQSLMKIIFRFLKEYENSIETIRRILRFCFLLYYVFVIPYRICFLRENLRIDDQFLLYNIFDYVVVDIFFLVDSFDILKKRWKRIRKWATAVLPIQESDKKDSIQAITDGAHQEELSTILPSSSSIPLRRLSLNRIREESNENDDEPPSSIENSLNNAYLNTSKDGNTQRNNENGNEPNSLINRTDLTIRTAASANSEESTSEQKQFRLPGLPYALSTSFSSSPSTPPANKKFGFKANYSILPGEDGGPQSVVTDTATTDSVTLDTSEAGRQLSNINQQHKNEVYPLTGENDSSEGFSTSFSSPEILQNESDSESERKFYYFENLFLLGLVFPFEIFAYICLGHDAQYNYLAIPKFVRILYFNRYWSQLRPFLDKNTQLQSSTAHRVMFMVIVMAMVAHVSACIFYALSINALKNGNDNTWLYYDHLVTVDHVTGALKYHANERYRYLRTLYWSVQTLDMVGFGDIVAHSESETWYCILYLYISVFLVYMSVSNLVIFINSLDLERNKYKLKMMKFEKYAKYRQLPILLIKRIKSFYSHQWLTLHGVNEHEVHSELPANMVEQVNQIVIRDVLMCIPQFHDLNKALLNALSDSIESFNYSPNEEIVGSRSRVAGIYIIAEGVLELVHHQHGFASTISKGDVFALNALYKSFHSIYKLRAKSFSEVLFLRGSVFRYICRAHLSAIEYDALAENFSAEVNKAESEYSMEATESMRERIGPVSRRTRSVFRMGKSGLALQEYSWRLFFSPDSSFRMGWDCFIFACMIFYLTSTPLLYAGAARQDYWSHFQSLLLSCYLVDFILVLDYGLKCTIFGYRERGILIINTTKIFKNFVAENNLFIIALSLLPFEIVLLSGNLPLWTIPLLRSLKLLHLRAFEKYLTVAIDALNLCLGIILSFEMTRFIILYFALFELCHWVGCFLQLTADVSTSSLLSYDTNWRKKDMDSEFLSINYRAHELGFVSYCRSIFWAVGMMSSIGFPEILPTNPLEIAVVIAVMFVGFLLFNMLLSAIASLIGSFNKDKKEFDAKVEKMKRLLTEKSVPEDLSVKILLYYEYIWARYGGVEEKEVLRSLPKSLRLTVMNFVVGPSVLAVPFFSSCSDQLLDVLVTILEPRIFLHGDLIVRYGESATEMFIIERGNVHICSQDRKTIYATLTTGSYIGESCLLEVQKRTASATSVGYVDAYCIKRSVFLKIADQFPDEYKTIAEAVSKSLEEKKRRNSTVLLNNIRKQPTLKSADFKAELGSFADSESEANNVITEEKPVKKLEHKSDRDVTTSTVTESESIRQCSAKSGNSETPSQPPSSTADISPIHATDTESNAKNLSRDLLTSDMSVSIDIADTADKEQGVSAKVAGTERTESSRLLTSASASSESSPGNNQSIFVSYMDSFRKRMSTITTRSRKSLPSRSIPQTSPLHPDSKHRLALNVLVFSSLLYYLIIIPMQISLNMTIYILIADYVVDALNILDNYLRWRVLPIFHGGEMVVEEAEIRKLYWSESALIDIVAALPYDIICLAFLPSNFLLIVRAILRIPKLLKCTRIGSYQAAVDHAVKLLKVNQLVYFLLQITVSLSIVANWVSCFFLLLAEYQNKSSSDLLCTFHTHHHSALSSIMPISCDYYGTWVQLLVELGKLPADGGSQWVRLFYSFSWAIQTLTAEATEIFPVNENESLYTFFAVFCGLSVNGAIIGSIIDLVAESNGESARTFRKIDALLKILVANKVPPKLIESASKTLMYVASEEGNIMLRQDAIISDLPHSMKMSMESFLKIEPFLRKCPFFDYFTDDILREISSKLERKIYCKGDDIVVQGDLGHEMFFLCQGTVNVVSGDKKITYSTLESGAFFGETALFFSGPRTATVEAASGICVCLVLSKAVLEDETKACEIDTEKVLESFRSLNQSNQRRNTAVKKNLALAKDPTSKLSKIIHIAHEENPRVPIIIQVRKYLNPSSNFRFVWEVMGFTILLYYTFSIPFFVSFLFGKYIDFYFNRYIAVDIIFDIFWIFDIVLNVHFFSFNLESTGELCTDGGLIRKNYLVNGHFILDCIASIPLELFVLIPGVGRDYLFFFRTIHLIRIPQLFDYWSHIGKHVFTKYNFFLDRATSLLLKAGIAYITANHIFSCVYFGIHRYAERGEHITYVVEDGFATYNAATHQHDICNTYLSYCYSRSVYFVLETMTSVSYGDIIPFTLQELAWEVIMEILSAFIAAAFLGYSTIYLENRDAAGDKSFKAKLASIQNYCSYRKLPPALKSTISAQYTHIWKKSRSLTGNFHELLSDLSEPCLMEICMQLNSELIKATPVLNDSSHYVQRRLAAALRPQIVLANEFVYKAGFSGMSLFLVHSGAVKLQLTDDMSMIDTYGFDALKLLLQKEIVHGDLYRRGDHFGELCFLSKMGLRPDMVRAVTRSELYFLSKEDTWRMFRYLLAPDRRRFLHHLMTRVGDKEHTHHELVEDDDKHSRNHANDFSLRHFYKMAYLIFKQILTSSDLGHINDAVQSAHSQDSAPANSLPLQNASKPVSSHPVTKQRHSILLTLHSEFHKRKNSVVGAVLSKEALASAKHHRRASATGSHHHHGSNNPSPGSEGRQLKHGHSFDENDPLHSEGMSSPEPSIDGSRRNSLSDAAGSRRNTINGIDLQSLSLHQGRSVGDEDQEEDEDDEDDDDDDGFSAPVRSSLDKSLSFVSKKVRRNTQREGGQRRQSLFLAAATMMSAENLHNDNTRNNTTPQQESKTTPTLPETPTQSSDSPEATSVTAAAVAAAIKPRSRKNSSVRFEDSAIQDTLAQSAMPAAIDGKEAES